MAGCLRAIRNSAVTEPLTSFGMCAGDWQGGLSHALA